jgi:hypothetical protein
MSRGSNGEGSDGSASSGRARTPSPYLRDPDDVKVRLARIIISHDGENEYDWDGTEPKPGDTLFVYYVEVSDITYHTCIKDDDVKPRDDKRKFDHFRSKKNNVTISYLYSPNIIRKAPPLHSFKTVFVNREKNSQASLLPNLMSKGRIFQNTDFSCWYKLESPDVYSDQYHLFKEDYDFLDVKVYDDLNPREYMSISNFVTRNPELKILKREIGDEHPCFRCIFKQKASSISTPTPSGGGKTRRKFKVKKRRNRRIRNTMKRRKTAVKRRKGRK